MSQTMATLLITALFSFTGLLWGFILAAICIEELQEFYDKIQKSKVLMVSLTTAALFFISTKAISTKLSLATIIFLAAIAIFAIGFKYQDSNLELLTLIPTSIVYIILIQAPAMQEYLLLLSSSVLLYYFLIGINLHCQFLGIKKLLPKTKPQQNLKKF